MTFHEQWGGSAEENEVCENKIHLPDCHVTFGESWGWEFQMWIKDCQKQWHIWNSRRPTLKLEDRRTGKEKKCIFYLHSNFSNHFNVNYLCSFHLNYWHLDELYLIGTWNKYSTGFFKCYKIGHTPAADSILVITWPQSVFIWSFATFEKIYLVSDEVCTISLKTKALQKTQISSGH